MRAVAIALVLLAAYVAISAMDGLTRKPPVTVDPAPVIYTPDPQPEPTPEPPKPATLRAYVVVECKADPCRNPRCPSAPHMAAVKELRAKGWQLTVLDKSEAAKLPVEGDKFPYVVVTADGERAAGKFLDTAFGIGTWLNEQKVTLGGEWEQNNTPAAPLPSKDGDVHQGPVLNSGLYSLALVTDPEHCPPCAALERDRASIEQELGAEFRIVAPGTQEFPCRSIPTVFLLLDGKPVAQTSGYRGKRAFLSWLAKAEREHGGRWR